MNRSQFIRSTVDEQCNEFETIINTTATNVINTSLSAHVQTLFSGIYSWKETIGSEDMQILKCFLNWL